ncbi:MarR family winged helix-turn-helix transcriptional regulator [Streptomyces sp. YIM 98790]|uniref:MarR family winged helix-turn-helix transcriptional regulator n=1 Tax=Streptomyces sp. YIM 98790 TaxID=2689077 RepID=UPI0014073220|nr:MarR family transcriptional regulator [Streptomyces sp. YIM 98790]
MSSSAPLDPEALRVFASALHRTARMLRRLSAPPAGHDDLSPAELDVVRVVTRHPGIGVSRLAEVLRLKPSNLSATLRPLLDRGWVRREPAPEDRRAALLHPTERAREGLRQVEENRARLLAEVLRELPGEQAGTLLRAAPAMEALSEALTGRKRDGMRPAPDRRPEPGAGAGAGAEPGGLPAESGEPRAG